MSSSSLLHVCGIIIFRLIAEKQVPQACIKFSKENGKLFHEKGIVPNFMTHLISLFDIGLITPTTIKESMCVVYELETRIS